MAISVGLVILRKITIRVLREVHLLARDIFMRNFNLRRGLSRSIPELWDRFASGGTGRFASGGRFASSAHSLSSVTETAKSTIKLTIDPSTQSLFK